MELLIRIVDKVSDDPYLDCKLTKRGDVIVAMPDGHEWTPTELNNPDWWVVKCPEMGEAEAYALVQSEPGDEKTNKMLQRRAFKVDVDALEQSLKGKPNVLGKNPKLVTLGKALMRSVKTTKVALSDPNIIGPAVENVIG